MTLGLTIPEDIASMSEEDKHLYLGKLSDNRINAVQRLDQWSLDTYENGLAYVLRFPHLKIAQVAARDIFVLNELIRPFEGMLEFWPRDRVLSIGAPTPKAKFDLFKLVKYKPDEETYLTVFGGGAPDSVKEEFFIWCTATETA